MLQQTTVATVIPYYRRWLRLFPDVSALARAPLNKVLKAWEGLGYYERAKRLHGAARRLCRESSGVLPRSEAELRQLPGFGPNTAAAVLSLGYGLPVPVLDVNVRRVIGRIKGRADGKGVAADRAARLILADLIDRDHPAGFNQAMMELGALVCRPRQPSCPVCPVRRFCLAFRTGRPEIGAPAKKSRATRIETVVAVIEREDRYLIQQRPPSGLMAGLWEFPGGKREKPESLEGALRRELREELGALVKSARLLVTVRHAYTRFRVTLRAYDTVLKRVPALDPRTHRWVTLKGLKRYPFPSANSKIIDFLERRERDHRP